jgi:NAD dependent epimerase/dehydratase family enzyme
VLHSFSSVFLDSQRVQPKQALTRAYEFKFPQLHEALLDLTEPQQ